MLKKIITYFFITCCIGTGIYPIIYYIMGTNFGFLTIKTKELLASNLWISSFYTHITFGGIGLLIGWLQFNKKLRLKNIKLHRIIGKIYVITCLISALAAFYLAIYATGGLGPKVGFTFMAFAWFTSTYKGFLDIKKGAIIAHQKMMIYSYAVCFSAVTLRIWLPLLENYFHAFLPAYRIVAWLSWIPNLIVAYFIIKYTIKPQQV